MLLSYTENDALQAAAFLWQNATFANGVNLTTNNCIYKNADSTIVSVCNGDHRNRTIYKDEGKRGIEQLMQDCGGGGSLNGVHVVNNLTFAAYGIYGGKNMVIPTGANPPYLLEVAGDLSHTSRTKVAKDQQRMIHVCSCRSKASPRLIVGGSISSTPMAHVVASPLKTSVRSSASRAGQAC